MSLVRHSALTFAGRILSYFILALNGLLIARLLGPQGRGEYALLIMTVNFAVVALTFGLGTSNVYFVSQRKIAKEKLFFWSLIIGTLAGVIAIAILWAFDVPLVQFFIKGVSPENLRVIAFVVPANLIYAYLLGVAQGEQRFVLYNGVNLARLLISLGLFLLLFFIGMNGVRAGLWAYVAGFFGSALVLIFSLYPQKARRFKVDLNGLSELFRYGWKVYLFELFAYSSHRIDLFFIGYFLDTVRAGYYSIVILIAESVWFLTSSVSIALLPAAGYRSAESMRAVVPIAVRSVVFITAIGIGCFFLLDRFLLELAFGKDFLPALTPFRVMYLGILMMSAIKVIASYALSQNKTSLILWINVVGFILNFVLNLYFIPRWGIAGAALATCAGYSLKLWLFARWLLRDLEVSLRKLFVIQPEDFRKSLTWVSQKLNFKYLSSLLSG